MLFLRRLFVTFAVLVLALGSQASANPMLLIDTDSGAVLFEQEAGAAWHPASLTKLMTAFVAFQAISEGRVSLDTPVIISKRAFNQAPSKSGLKVDSALSMQDALYVMLVKSANDVAVAIAETVGGSEKAFVAEMNDTATKLGMTNTHYVNANGLHDDGQVTSARDLAVLSLYIRQLYPQYLPIFETEAVTLGKANLESNNDLLTHFAGTTGMKTGYVCASGLNIVATAQRNGRSLMAVVLGGVSARERGEMTAELFLRGFSGALGGTGKTILQVANTAGAAADMRPLICGKQAKAYVAEREAAYPIGLKGQPSYLTDEVKGRVYAATNLGQLRDVPLPRPRPGYASIQASTPVAAVAIEQPANLGAIVPRPRPRP
ncbi:D-alanyl-D-alanine carboxypeptidase family protein [Paradevosia shaoguanensis]|uniref:D-alanyl-D-alanine carboxypeptidase family protein n=1 Tax=Paradevosia shaoguanensis TaxID=1335043 RepID=UPI0019345599|nr:D-alanyl-D-alanine carboxypeptidase family protein [Paradevosia shaoguanensis]